MKVKTVDADQADILSAKALFAAVRTMYWKSDTQVLDAFARNGQLTVAAYKDAVNRNDLHCWELGPEHEAALREVSDDVRIGCSYKQLLQELLTGNKYDLLVIDTPQGLHDDAFGEVHVEHFDFLHHAAPLVADDGVIVLYVNKAPYNKFEVGSHGYDEYAEYDFDKWMEHRRAVYGTSVITEEQAIETYRGILANVGLDVKSLISMPCFSDVPGKDPYAFRLALQVARR